MTPTEVAALVMSASFMVALGLCTGLCLVLWYRRLQYNRGDANPSTFLMQAKNYPMTLFLPTVPYSEAGSEPRTPANTPTDRPRGGAFQSCDVGSEYHQPTLSSTDYPRVFPAIKPPGTWVWPGRPRSASPCRVMRPSSQRGPPPFAMSSVGHFSHRQLTTATTDKVSHSDGERPREWLTSPQHSCDSSTATTPGTPDSNDCQRWILSQDDEERQNRGHSEGENSFQNVEASPSAVQEPSVIGYGLGVVTLRLQYSDEARLRITLVSAFALPRRLGPVKTYAKVSVLPERKTRFRTDAVSATHSVTFPPDSSTVSINLSLPALAIATLRLSVCQVWACGRRVVVGYASLPLATAGLLQPTDQCRMKPYCDQAKEFTLPLLEIAPDHQVRMSGQLTFGLSWDAVGRLVTVTILNAFCSGYEPSGLGTSLQSTQSSQVYVKVSVFSNASLVGWRRTSPRLLAPSSMTSFREAVTVHLTDLDASSLVLSLREKTGPGGGRRVLGCVAVGGAAGDEGRNLWRDMSRAAPDTVFRSLPLSHSPALDYPTTVSMKNEKHEQCPEPPTL